MTILRRYTVAHRPTFAVVAVDRLAQALAARGPIAPPNCPLSCAVVEQLTPTARPFTPPRMLELLQGPNGALLLDGRYRLGDGPVRDVPLGDGTYKAELRGEYYRPQPFDLSWPPATVRAALVGGVAMDVELLPSAAYPYPDITALPFNLGPTLLRGSAFTAAGDPVVNARVDVPALPPLNPAAPPWPFTETRTGAAGDWALLLPDRRRFGVPGETTAQAPMPMVVRVRDANGVFLMNYNLAVTLGRENAAPNTTLRGQVTRAGGRPLGSVVISTSVNALASRTRDDGRWALYFDPNQASVPNVSVTATAPDGSTMTLNGVALQRQATVVVPTLHLP